MATIELDIIKLRSEKLLSKEKIELINHIIASLSPEEIGKLKKMPDLAKSPAKQTPTSSRKKTS